MKLKDLYPLSAGTSLGEREVGKVTNNSMQVAPGDVFVRGVEDHGDQYAQAAIQAGASVVLCDKDLGLDNQLVVKEPRKVFAEMCAAYFSHPARKIKLIGVTGTNGKTSTCLMIKSILESFGHKTGLIGTVHNMVGNQVLPAKNTTPGAYELHSLFSLMEMSGCEYAVMEVSSHALDQDRIHGLHFACGVYTNLTQDHLDYHVTMENYRDAKKKLFTMCDTAIVNCDDPYANDMIEGCQCPVVTYSLATNQSDYVAKNFRDEISLEKMAYDLGISKYVLSRLFAKTFHCNFNKYVNG
ncbi:MAG: UDP-N-acetylmuramoyl-L-alanyl-D-glutamate--2,6-diaminopimelate ligase, partial [Clostridia bacterium]|nr:UDP-N-acetylmuramoyl-L-alanyl-D-glutamate--2,6-diaminopimelate ligase [Clostridia bacterium]